MNQKLIKLFNFESGHCQKGFGMRLDSGVAIVGHELAKGIMLDQFHRQLGIRIYYLRINDNFGIMSS